MEGIKNIKRQLFVVNAIDKRKTKKIGDVRQFPLMYEMRVLVILQTKFLKKKVVEPQK